MEQVLCWEVEKICYEPETGDVPLLRDELVDGDAAETTEVGANPITPLAKVLLNREGTPRTNSLLINIEKRVDILQESIAK